MGSETIEAPPGSGRDGGEPAGGEYAATGDKPLGGYAVLTAIFGAGVTAASIATAARGRDLPDEVRVRDVAMIGIATHKLTRLIAKDRVTSFIRAPFARYQDEAGHGEVEEEAKGEGLRKATGELLTCPYCLGQWVAAAFGVGYVASPRLTRLVAAVYTAETISDFMQLAYKTAEERAA